MEQVAETFGLGAIDQLEPQKREYAATKLDAELAIQKLGQQNIKLSVARCFSFVGKHLPRLQHFAIGNFIENGLNNQTIQVKATNSVFRSYMYADDLVQWLMVIASNGSKECPIYNVGSNESILIGDLAIKIGSYFNVFVNIPEISMTKIDRYIPSIEKAQKELGLNICFDLDLAIERTIYKIKNN